ncbi:MAG: uncharacterized protein KVP18_003641 [Porospora cf. gigantea A]|uniref:uncharacterized protein n=1 Tax=Porospora cf. gigantea A TaxID=2853593 RepID=UPI00355A9589|nr:MAG: hypothetical protein KVP18_003641 [Porospora cf. gigantea A]
MPILDGSSMNVLGVRPGTSLENRERVRRLINDKKPALVICPVHFVHSRESAASFSSIKRLLRTASPLEAHFERVVSRTLFGVDIADSRFQPRTTRPLRALHTFIRQRKDAEIDMRSLVRGLGRRLRLGEVDISQGLRSELLERATQLNSEVGRYVSKWLDGVSSFTTVHFRAGDRQIFRPNPSVKGVLRCLAGHREGELLFLVSDAIQSIPDEWLDNVVLLSTPDVPTTAHLTSFRSLERDFRGMITDWLWMLNSDKLVSNSRSGFSRTASLTADISVDSCHT